MPGLDLAIRRPGMKPSIAEACAMRELDRRGFLATSAAASAVPLLPDLGFLASVSRAAAADTRIDPNQVRPSPSIGRLIKLIRTTPRDRCVPVFIEQLRSGLSYQDLLSALLLATIEHGDPHQVAGVYSAHRVSSEARVEERLLPLFWARGPWWAPTCRRRGSGCSTALVGAMTGGSIGITSRASQVHRTIRARNDLDSSRPESVELSGRIGSRSGFRA